MTGRETTLGRMAFPRDQWARLPGPAQTPPKARPAPKLEPAAEKIVRLVVETPEERAARKAAADLLSCRRKGRYDKRGAMGVVNQRKGRGAILRAYPCPVCHGWHITNAARRD